jgi:hypothetical protein
MEALSNNIIRIQTSGFFSSSFRRGAIVDLTRGVNHNPRTNPRSRIPCKFFSKKSKYRFEDDYKFSHTNQGPIKQSTPTPPTGSGTEKTSQGPSSAPIDPPRGQPSHGSTAPPTQSQRRQAKNCYDLLEEYCDSLIEKDKPEILQPQFT